MNTTTTSYINDKGLPVTVVNTITMSMFSPEDALGTAEEHSAVVKNLKDRGFVTIGGGAWDTGWEVGITTRLLRDIKVHFDMWYTGVDIGPLVLDALGLDILDAVDKLWDWLANQRGEYYVDEYTGRSVYIPRPAHPDAAEVLLYSLFRGRSLNNITAWLDTAYPYHAPGGNPLEAWMDEENGMI